ncbi:MAG: enoyl-CoA hydratase-related protein [Roseococcus sp.]|nr:enoyl-CoA hydratase-related protein [Roseococcus sp.]
MSAPPVLVAREGAVVHVTLNRPERRNAIGGGMGEALDAVLADLAQDRAARVVVLRGAGGHFCAGLDLTEVGQGPREERLAAGERRNRAMGERLRALSALPQVVVAAVEGAAHAGGLGFVCAADIALASAEARFAAPEVRRGLVPAQILPWLVRRMGRSQAARLVLEAEVLDAPAALAAGLVHEVLPDRAGLDQRLARLLAALREAAPGALAETKALLAALGPVAPEGYGEAAVAAFARTAAGAEAAEGIAAFREKRKPAWAV